MRKTKTLIVVPAYNEAKNIGHALDALLAHCAGIDILVVSDGSFDETADIARTYPVRVVSHPCNMGYGAALQTGYRFAVHADYDLVVQFDGDGQHDARDVSIIIEGLETSVGDIVIGSRFMGDPNFSPGFLKMLAIRFFRGMIRWVTANRISDPTSGLRGLRRPVFTYYAGFNRLPVDFPDADFLIDASLRKWKIREVAIGNQQRTHGHSMHAGLKPIVYMFKVFLSILVIVLNYTLLERRTSHE